MPANVETMAYRFADRSDTPWHGLGVPVDRNEQISTTEFQKRAGAAWTVEDHPLWIRATAQTPFKEHIKTDLIAKLRSDNHFHLHTATKQYQTIQNDITFNFFDEMCSQGDMDVETGGVLNRGRTVWCLASIREGFTLYGGERVQGNLLFYNIHGSNAGGIKFTPIVVVCANTLALALSGEGAHFRIHHKSKFDPDVAKNALGLGHKGLSTFKEQAEFLVSRKMDDTGYTRFLNALFPPTMELQSRSADHEEMVPVYNRNYHRAVEALDVQVCNNALRGTWWNGYNAITYMVDHMNPAADKSRALNAAWFGTGEKLKVQALTTALEMAR